MSKADDAKALMKSAKKHYTKTITKWSVDYDLAADDYEKAAKIYTHLKLTNEAREAWLEASAAHTKAKNPFFAAKCIDNLAQYLKEDEAYAATDKGAKEISDLYIQVSDMYALDGKPERQAEALQQAAKLTPTSDAPAAAAKILRAIDALEDNDKHHHTPDAYRALLLVQVRANMTADAINTLKRQMKTAEVLNQPATAAKAGLEIVVLSLASGDFVLADQEFRALQQAYGFGHSREQTVAFDLMNAFEERDEEQLKTAVKSQVLQFLIPDIARLAKRLKLSGVTNVPAQNQARVVGEAAPPPAAEEEDEDDLR